MRLLFLLPLLWLAACADEQHQAAQTDSIVKEEAEIPDTIAYVDTFTVRKPRPLTAAEQAEHDSVLADAAALAQKINAGQDGNDEKRFAPAPNDEIITSPDAAPAFKGGEAAMNEWLKRNLIYPPTAWQNNVRGMVLVRFVVEKDGSLSGVTIIRPLSPDCDQAALRAIMKMPEWVPGRKAGKPVRTVVTLPLSFVPGE
ncbi:MAG: energy transducer TonB [Bacteroidia bacterium]|jgi:protein TonB|nr:energy transducer TonB [Bacteroidia bacterium]